MRVTLRYFDGCPHWRTAEARLGEALVNTGHDGVVVAHERVESPEDAARLGFVGSPTVLVDGIDPFAREGSPVGFACRVHMTPEGLAGSPTVDQLMEVLR